MKRVLIVLVLALASLGVTSFAAASSASTCTSVVHRGTHLVFRWHVVKVREHGKLIKRREHVWRYVERREHGKLVKVRAPVKVRRVYSWTVQSCVDTVSTPQPAVQPPVTTTPVTTPPTTTQPVTVTYTAVDPTFTQDPTNALAVTYAYSASASTSTGVDLAATGQLPAGILNLFWAGQLECSLNVGGSTIGGSCLVAYADSGSYPVIVEYLPTGAIPVSTTTTEVISPYPTATAVDASYSPGTFPDLGTLVTGIGVAEGGTPITPVGAVTETLTDTADGATLSWAVTGSPLGCSWYVDIGSTGTMSFNEASPVSTCTPPQAGHQGQVDFPTADFLDGLVVVTASYAGSPGWASSTSAPVATDS